MKFKQQFSGEWVLPRRKNYYMKCCGCGLVHRMNFKLVPSANGGNRIAFQAFRVKKRRKVLDMKHFVKSVIWDKHVYKQNLRP